MVKTLKRLVGTAAALVGLYAGDVHGHGFLAQPAARQIVWSDNTYYGPGDKQSLAAGGPGVEKTEGHGLCGDLASRKGFMAPSQYGPTEAIASYGSGEWMDVTVQVTAHHKGWFEFRMCVPEDGGVDLTKPITQNCLNEHVLEFDTEHAIAKYGGKMEAGISDPSDYASLNNNVKCAAAQVSGSCCTGNGDCSGTNKRWVLPSLLAVPDKKYEIRLKLPSGVSAERAVLQWYWQTGNSPDSYPEAFWNCADIGISGTSTNPVAPTASTPTASPPTASPPTASPPTASPPTASGGGAKRCVSNNPVTSDEWCAAVACADAYVPGYCKWVGGDETVPAPTASPPTASPPTASPPTASPPTASPPTASTPAPAPVASPPTTGDKIDVIGFYGNSGLAVPYIPRFNEIPCYYNIIILTFINFDSNGNIEFDIQGPYSNNKQLLKSDLAAWKADSDPYGRSKKAMISIGGQNGHWPEGLSAAVVESRLREFMADYGLDGLDIDLEGSAVESASTLVPVIRSLRSDGYTVAASPEAAQGPLNAYSSIIGELDYWHPQFYNNPTNAVAAPYIPSGPWNPPAHWQDNTPAGYQDAGIAWWANVLKVTSNHFGLEASQRGMLVPATTLAAGNNNDYDLDLLRDQIEANGITHVGTWAIAYDNKINYGFARRMASIMGTDRCPSSGRRLRAPSA